MLAAIHQCTDEANHSKFQGFVGSVTGRFRALAAPNLRDIFAKKGIDGVPPWTPEQFGAFLKKETVRWKGAIEAAGIKPE